MSDTYLQDCKYCGDHTDCIQGVCMNCNEAENFLEPTRSISKLYGDNRRNNNNCSRNSFS